MKPRRAAALTSVLLCTALVAGCGGASARAADENGRGPITLAQGKDPSGVMPELVRDWNRLHPAEPVDLIELPESVDMQRQAMVQNAQLKSDAFTVLDMDVVWTAEFAAHRWIDELPREGFALDSMLPSTVETATYRDRLYAVPASSDGALLFYRKDLLDKVGAKPPKTWRQLERICQRVRELPEAADIGCYAGQLDKSEGGTANVAEVINSAGGHLLDEQGRPDVDTPQARAGLNFLVDGIEDGTIPREALTYKEEEGRRAFTDGKLLFHRQWPYQWSSLSEDPAMAGKFDVAPLPGLDGPGTSSLGGHSFAVSKYGVNKATARDFIRYATSERQQRENMLTGSKAPTISRLYEDPELRSEAPYLPVLKKSILGAEPRPRVVRYGKLTAAVQDTSYAAMQGEISTEQALRDLQRRLEELMRP